MSRKAEKGWSTSSRNTTNGWLRRSEFTIEVWLSRLRDCRRSAVVLCVYVGLRLCDEPVQLAALIALSVELAFDGQVEWLFSLIIKTLEQGD